MTATLLKWLEKGVLTQYFLRTECTVEDFHYLYSMHPTLWRENRGRDKQPAGRMSKADGNEEKNTRALGMDRRRSRA